MCRVWCMLLMLVIIIVFVVFIWMVVWIYWWVRGKVGVMVWCCRCSFICCW